MNQNLISILAEVFDLKTSEITMDLTKESISNWDSLTQMDLVSSLEKGFNVEFEMLEMVSLTSIQEIISTLKKKGINLED